MGTLEVSGVDKETLRNSLLEAFQLFGTSATLYEVVEEKVDQNKDVEYSLEPKQVSILFEEHPKPVLQKNGWLVEGDETPFVVYILPKDDKGRYITVNRGAKITVPYISGEDGTRDMFVGRSRMDSLYGLFYIATLTPYRVNMPENADTGEKISEFNPTGNNLFKKVE